MTESLLTTRPANGVALLTLNRPEAMNAIDMELAARLAQALDALEADDGVRVLVITGAGERAFSAGFDIREMAGFDAEAMTRAFEQRDPLIWRMASHRKPVIMALNGVTYGAGALMAAAADIRIGCAATRFKVTATSYGSANATWSLPRVVGIPKAKEILMTGRVVEADEALAIGLLSRLERERTALDGALEMAATIAANPPLGVQGVKALINGSAARSLEGDYRAEFDWMMAQMGSSASAGADVFAYFLNRPDPGAT